MKILYIGKFEKFYRTERYIAEALESLGVGVRICPWADSLNFRIVKSKIRRWQVDAVLFSKPSAPWCGEVIDFCRVANIPTACWLFDLFWGQLRGRERPIQIRADYLFTTDSGHDTEWRSVGANPITLRQGIHAPDYQIFEPSYRYDVAFVGTVSRSGYYRDRWRLVHRLREHYGSRFIHHTKTRGLALNRALAEAKVIVGDSIDSPCGGYWSNRIYEITGRGGFFLHPETVGLGEEFTAGEHYVEYRRGDVAQVFDLIDRYCADDAAREHIRLAGWERCGRYTYTERCRLLLDSLPPPAPGVKLGS